MTGKLLTGESIPSAVPSSVAKPMPTMRALVACNIGVCLEGFDFIAYSAFATIFARLFFPADDPLISALLVFGGFGVAYVVRPIGGLFWGIYADRAGRKPALAALSIAMGAGTLLMALTPPYAAIGLAAPLFILAGRAIQGFSASGEFASATAMLVEMAPPHRRTFYASTQMASQIATIALAYGIVLVLTETLSPEAVSAWGWRAVFLAGAMIGPLGLYMRMHVPESPSFEASDRARAGRSVPILKQLQGYRTEILCIAGIVAGSASALYLIFVFLPVFAVQQLGLAGPQVQSATMICAIIEIPIILAVGWLGDRNNPARLLWKIFALTALLSGPALFWLIDQPSLVRFAAVQLGLSIFLGLVSGPMPFVISQLLPVEIRTSGIGLIFNCVAILFGGLAPFLITAFVGLTGDPHGPAYWATLTACAGAASSWMIRRRPL